jgi:exodeoxyribonuclease V alpha subunit
VVYNTEQLTNVVLAYAMTIHKSQGCEYPGIIIAMLPEHYIMLQRNLFYTAVTRARTACVVVGDEKSMQIAITNNQIAKRYTALGWFLKHPAPIVSPDMLVEEPEVEEVEVETDDEEEEVDTEELIHQLAF